jgi:NAD(P) transhydrogenase
MGGGLMYDLVVIGAGPAGQKAAIQGAKAGRRVLIIEEEQGVGGACVHHGTIPSKTLRETAVALSSLGRKCGGVIRCDTPPDLQIASLLARKDEVIRAHERFIAEQLGRNGVERWHGRARFASPREIDVTGVAGGVRRVEAEAIIIATGSRPRAPAKVPIDHDQVLDSDSILSMLYLPQSLTVLGGGVIACEYASIFASLGVRVTMIDRAPRPLGFLDTEIVARFVSAFERSGGTFLGDRSIESVVCDRYSGVVTKLADGTSIASEKLLCALGRVANVEGLEIGRAGLEPSTRGLIDVDAHGRTKVPHIYAAGDVIGPPSLASSAMEQGRRAACHALGIDAKGASAAIPAGIFTIPEIASVGMTKAAAVAALGGAQVGRAEFGEIARGQIAGAADGMLELIADGRGERVVGVQIVGEGATELVHVGLMAIVGALSVEAFVEQTFNFPTFAEAYRVAALDLVKRRGRPM